MLELAEIWNLDLLVMFLFIRTFKFSKNSLFSQLENQSPNLGHWLFLKHSSDLGWKEY
jgi:hypothetical protein